jgi:altronate hydrolase
MSNILVIDERDNVGVALTPLTKGTTLDINGVKITLKGDIGQAHKFALNSIKKGENIIKYGSPIGHALENIELGEFVHNHNIKTNLDGLLNYTFNKEKIEVETSSKNNTFMGYKRENGTVGIRNEVWIINTVGCVNRSAERISSMFENVYTFVHPYGCSQLGDDHKTTQKILKNLVNHPNAGGVLVLGLGCENNNIKDFKKVLGSYDEHRVRFLETQAVEDELVEAKKIITELLDISSKDTREELPLSSLTIGLKCGGSDGLSGITANPLLGTISNKIIDLGGTSILTEVPEMFGAEELIMNRAKDEKVFEDTVDLINNFKSYFTRHNQVVYENPSPGNKDGGISTL